QHERRSLRACLLCGLVKSANQFRVTGCENCEEVLKLKDSNKRIIDCTSSNFDGMIAQLNPAASWVAKWQRTDKFVQGMYAIRVSGRLPESVVDDLGDNGIKYRPRDGSVKD
ncbi:Spt4/RpoE2 zinc finger-domain-containing protein, partial [Phlyctochytrium arcticum]